MQQLDIEQIKIRLKHRYPFLLIDRVLEVNPGVSSRAQKNVTANEPQFMGHFPERFILPGVLQIEIMAQNCGIALLEVAENRKDENAIPFLAKVDQARFRSIVTPGDVLIIYSKITNLKAKIAFTENQIFVRDCNGKETLVSEAKLTLALKN